MKKSIKEYRILVCLLLSLVLAINLLSGCNSSKKEASSYGWTLIKYFSGDTSANTDKFSFTKKSNQIWIKTTNNQSNGLQARIFDSQNKVKGAYSVGSQPMEDIWALNVDPGEYYLEIKTGGTKYEIKVEER
ncbi:MAG: hypothetical protein GX434_08615 [Peptococcaceae bacterium]|nr:hypothetical protein [Peptococcaceae bacterium]